MIAHIVLALPVSRNCSIFTISAHQETAVTESEAESKTFIPQTNIDALGTRQYNHRNIFIYTPACQVDPRRLGLDSR